MLQLYVDVEHTGRDAQFIEKFEQRRAHGRAAECAAPGPRAVLHMRHWFANALSPFSMSQGMPGISCSS